MKVRTRFAPSPTGYLHIGGARTALFCYLFSRHHDGDFILRIEDTDRERSTRDSVQAILDGMRWLGLDYDEGPYYQTEHMDRYRQVIEQLLEQGDAYHCYCSKAELEQMREEQIALGLNPRYDGRYRNFEGAPPADIEPVVRFKNPQQGKVAWDDAVKGRIEIDNQELDDLVIARADGSPTYNLTVVVDDIDMQISHVVRGDDHVNNTPRQINIYRALKATLPTFAHVPMILGDDGQRLSKRHGAVGVMQYRDDGFVPKAVLNYLVRLGWSHGDQELFDRQQMIELFDLRDVNRSPSTFNTEKLLWLNEQYIKQLPSAEVAAHLRWHLSELEIDLSQGPELTVAVELLKERASTLKQMATQAAFLYQDFDDYEDAAARKHLKAAAQAPLRTARELLGQLNDWQAATIQQTLEKVVESLEIGFGKLGQPLRVALTGRGAAPGNDAVLAALGKSRALARIDRAVDFIQARVEAAQARGR